MKATWNGKTLAEAKKEDLIYIEGNWYFPPESIHKEYFSPTKTQTTCYWKGEASYYTVNVNDMPNQDAAWYYAVPKAGSIERVKKDFTNYVAFWHGVLVNE